MGAVPGRVVGVHELDAGDRGDEVEEPVGVRRRHDEEAFRRDELSHRAQERPRRVEVLDDLAGDDHLRRLKPEAGHGLGRLRVDGVRLEPVLGGPADALLLDVEPDEGGGGLGEAGVQPGAALALRLQAMLVHEADVDDALPARELKEHLLAIVRPAARKALAPAGAGERFPAVLGDGGHRSAGRLWFPYASSSEGTRTIGPSSASRATRRA